MGYIIPVIQEKFKEAKIIALHIENFPEHPGVHSLCSLESAEIENFLDTHLNDAGSIQIIEWRPSLKFYKESYLKLLSNVVEFIKRADAGERTAAAFGKRWVKNFFRNTENINNTLLYRESSLPVIITGSGPCLEDAFPVIQKVQNYCLIIAASSSAAALSHNGIKPDFIIATDGGSWALRHLYSCFRENMLCETQPLAVNLCAALPSQSFNAPKLIINDGSLWQSIVLHELKIPSVIIPQRGTVTATAAELAMIISRGNIFLAGTDLSAADIRTHVKPYNFDSLFFERANRFAPYYSDVFKRSSLILQGGSMDIYASWFKTHLASKKNKIFSIKSGVNIFKDGNYLLNALCDKKNISNFFKIENNRNNDQPQREKGINALLSAIKNPRYSRDLKQELNSLLFPGNENVSERELETALNELLRNGISVYE